MVGFEKFVEPIFAGYPAVSGEGIYVDLVS
jgi:hypothetical protein